MNEHVADKFISDLSSTLMTYKDQAHTSRELEDLIDMSVHMIEALGALRSQQLGMSRETGSSK